MHRIRTLVVAVLGISSASSADAYIAQPPATLGHMAAWSDLAMLAKVEKVDLDKRIITYRRVRDLKGTWPSDVILHKIDPKPGDNKAAPPLDVDELRHIFGWAKEGQHAVLFAEKKRAMSHAYVDQCWYSSIYTGDRGGPKALWNTWYAIASAPDFVRTQCCGTPVELAVALTDMYAGKESVVPVVHEGSKTDLRQGRAKIQGLRVGLKIRDFDAKRDFVAWETVGQKATDTKNALPLLGAGAGQRPMEKSITITEGDLKVVFRDQVKSLSGVASLINLKDAPDWNALNPGRDGGLNFEHIISGHKNPNNKFTPRKGKLTLSTLSEGKSVQLVRNKEDEPWAMSSTITYTVVKPHYIDMDFRCVAYDKSLFGKRGYAILFFADYMNTVDDVALNFRGVEGPKQEEKWIKADASQGPRGKSIPDWDTGGTYRSLPAAPLEYDADHNFKLNSWSYDYPRFTKPFYFGKAEKGMVFMLMFNKMHTEEDEIRLSLFKFFVRPKDPRPAWDFQYVIHNIEENREYGFKARLVWKKFISPEDCLKEYEGWRATIGKAR